VVLPKRRKLPKQDWEGDDHIPGSGGKYVSCTDTATGRDLAWATNGRVDLDGKQIRAAVRPHDPDGITLTQAKNAVERLTNTTLIIPTDWVWQDVLNWSRLRRGLVIQGWYGALPRSDRFQLKADFGHAMFIPYLSSTSGFLNYDPLDPNTRRHGQWVRASSIRAFMETFAHMEGSRGLLCAYVPLQPL
jgi:hypothetical protein